LISSAWYARDDQAFRVGIWFSANGIANIVGGISAYGLGHIHVGGLSSWKSMFLVTGIVTVLWSIIVFFFLPSSQGTAKFLTEEEQVAAVEMVRGNNTGIHNKKFKLKQLKEALLDPKSYFFFWFAFFGNLANSIATVSTVYAFGSSCISANLVFVVR
jgi:ACS family allantoate permease-like MFS transporter